VTEKTSILDYDELRSVLPHRYPFLMVDRVMLTSVKNKAVGVKNVTINEPFFQGHFPGNPVMPGVLILEAMVQTGCVVIRRLTGTKAEFAFLKSISKAKFRKPVFPGDRLIIETELVRFRNGLAKLSASARVRDQQVCQAEFTLGIRENVDEILKTREFAPDLFLNGCPTENSPLKDIRGIMNTIPHRFPFIMVDSILGQKDPFIFGLKNVTGDEPFFAGHFPKYAVMPGSLLVEAMAQVGAVYILDQPQNRGKLGYFVAMDWARFKRPVRPGDQLVIKVKIIVLRQRFGKAHGLIYVGKDVVAEAKITFAIVDKSTVL